MKASGTEIMNPMTSERIVSSSVSSAPPIRILVLSRMSWISIARL